MTDFSKDTSYKTSKPVVDIAIACSSVQYSQWWVKVMDFILDAERSGIFTNAIYAISSALPDHNKNHTVTSQPFWNEEDKRRYSLTDANRGEGVKRFMDGDASWLMWLDDDTPPPKGALNYLLSLGRNFVGGLYFNPKAPYNPIAYIKRPDGLYHAFYGYTKGTLQRVDSIGMGCTLIHRSVYEKIMQNHRVYQRPNGSITAIHNDDIITNDDEQTLTEQKVINNVLHVPLTPIEDTVEKEADENRPFPFYVLEYGRTEDHKFCEMAIRVGIHPWLDTTIECQHIKPRGIGVKEYEQHMEMLREQRKQEERNNQNT